MNPKNLPQWYVVYTMPKSERKVAARIADMGIESYLPLHKVVRQWSDRKKKLEVPLFPNYVFVKVDAILRVSLFSIKELTKFVSIEKQPVVIDEKEILAIKKVLNNEEEVVPDHYFQEGVKVRVRGGHFDGLEGIIIKRRGRTRLLIKIEGLMKAFSFNVSTQLAEVISPDKEIVFLS